MSGGGGKRVAYSTGSGRICPRCGWPTNDCRCSSVLAADEEPIPAQIIAKLRLENRASGKSVTIVDGLPKNAAFLETLAKELKRACGTGGRAGQDQIELQGDQRERLGELLSRKGWTVKG